MNDIEKTTIERVNSGKRMRRRRRFMSVYALIVLLLVVFAGVLASLTFLFKVNEIIISGQSDTYTYMEVVNAADIRAGDNLIRMDTADNAQNILDSLLFVEEADVEKVFPSTIKIHVTQCVPAFNVEYVKEDGSGGGVLQVSRRGKILGINDYYVNDLPTIYGFEIDQELMIKGRVMQSSVIEKQRFYDQLMERFDSWDGSDIVYIDMTDPYDIEICYRTGVVFRMGDFTDVQYKLDLADSVMHDDSVIGKSGYLRMIGTHQCSFRTSTGPAEVPEIEPPVSMASEQPAVTTTVSTDDGLYRPPGFVTTAAPEWAQPVQTTPDQQDWNGGWQQDPWSAGQNNNGWNSGGGQNAGQNGGQWQQNNNPDSQQPAWVQQGYQSIEDWVNNRPAVGSEPDEGYFDEYGNFHYWWP